jgi:hypothetical protein
MWNDAQECKAKASSHGSAHVESHAERILREWRKFTYPEPFESLSQGGNAWGLANEGVMWSE